MVVMVIHPYLFGRRARRTTSEQSKQEVDKTFGFNDLFPGIFGPAQGVI